MYMLLTKYYIYTYNYISDICTYLLAYCHIHNMYIRMYVCGYVHIIKCDNHCTCVIGQLFHLPSTLKIKFFCYNW